MMRDLRYALRLLGRSPGYALTCVVVLALGIGANVAIFSVVNSIILRPLPYPDSSRLVFVWERFSNMPDQLGSRMRVAHKNYLEWKRQNAVFADMAAFREMSLSESGVDHPKRVSTGFASANFFPMLGVQARTGRMFASDEDRVAVLTDEYFETRFHRDPKTLGKSIMIGGTAYTVIGVLPPKFHLPATDEGTDQLKPEVWVPLSRLWRTADDDTHRQLLVTARLKRNVSVTKARTDMAMISGRLQRADPKLNEYWSASVFPFEVEDTAPKLHRALLVLLAAVAFLLLIACANLANLTLARATLRSREIAVRLALGATRARIIAQLVAEAAIVSIAGAAAGLLLAHWCIQLMLKPAPPDIQRPELIEIDLPVFVFAATASIVTTLLFGLAPAIAASRSDLNSALKAGGSWGASAARARSRQFLIAVEVGMALVLVTGAGLMIRSFREILSTGVGFETAHLTGADIDLPEKRYPDGASQSRLFRSLMDRTRSVPGVTGVSVTDNLPLHSVSIRNFSIVGRPEPPIDSLPISDIANVSPQYLSMLELRLEAGRFFTDADLAFTEKEKDVVAIVNHAFAQHFFPGENPVGRRLLSGDKKTTSEIIGVVSDYRPLGAENGTRPQIFWPYLKLQHASLVVRTAAAPHSFTKAIQNAVWSVDKEIAANKVETLDEHLDYWQSQRKFNTLLLAIFAGLALVLAMMGIYGVLANLVASRVREIGIRIAIGATPAAIGKLVLLQSMIPVMVGLSIGLAGSFMLGRFLEALLFQVRAHDPLTLALAASTVLLVSPLAICVPLRRAIRVDCMVALREE
jgi:predicted permease